MMALDAELVRRAHACLDQASLIAEARASNLDTSPISHGKPGTTPPTRDTEALRDTIARSLTRCTTDDQLRIAVYQAERAISRIKRTRPGPYDDDGRRRTTQENDQHIITEYADMPPDEAAAYATDYLGVRVTAENVRRVRRAHDRNPADGQPRSSSRIPWTSIEDRRAHVAAFHAEGRSLREAASGLGVSHPTIVHDEQQLGLTRPPRDGKLTINAGGEPVPANERGPRTGVNQPGA